MSHSSFYTIRDMARELALPESTVRYYRDVFSAFLPVASSGTRRLYPAESLRRIALIATGYADGKRRSEIETELASEGGTSTPNPTNGTTAIAKYDELLATVLDGERERRETLWQMAGEIVRLGEAIEQQHAVLGVTAERVVGRDRALAPGQADGELEDDDGIPVAESAAIDSVVEAELDSLRQELARERELVERLRRSKVEMERRVADAETQLGDRAPSTHENRRRSVFGKLLFRDDT